MKALAVFLFVFLFLAGGMSAQNRADPQIIYVTGTVIASSPASGPDRVTGQYSPKFSEDFLVRVDEDADGLKKGQYIRILHNHDDGKARLPEMMFTMKQ